MKRILMLVVVLITIAACSPTIVPEGSAVGATTAVTPPGGSPSTPEPTTSSPATATVPLVSATATSIVQPTTTFTTTTGVIPGGNLTNADMAKILEDSFTAYPWLLQFDVTNTGATEPFTGTIKAQSSVRVQTTIQQTVNSYQVMIDTVVISPTLYLKATDLPASVLQAVGMTPDQWVKITASQDTLNLAHIALAVADPAQLLANIGYQNLLNQANPSEKLYTLIGTERVEDVLTNVYELQVTSGNTTTTFHVAVGVDDGRVYEIKSENTQQIATMTMQYNSTFTVEPPIP
jgi:hypothetical protein